MLLIHFLQRQGIEQPKVNAIRTSINSNPSNTINVSPIIKQAGVGTYLHNGKPILIQNGQLVSKNSKGNFVRYNGQTNRWNVNYSTSEVLTANQVKGYLAKFSPSIKNGIQFLITKSKNTKNITKVTADGTGLSDADKDVLKEKVGADKYNSIMTKWKSLSNTNKNIFKSIGTWAGTGFVAYMLEGLLTAGFVAAGFPQGAHLAGMVLRSGKVLAGLGP